jgi:alanine racemase
MSNTVWPGRPVWAEIDLDALAHNARLVVERASPALVFAIVKANGYGHGGVMVARTALEAGAYGLGTVCVDEGEELRAAGLDAPILIVGSAQVSEAEAIVRLGLTPTVTSEAMARELSRAAGAYGATVRVHVELESGLNRNGLAADDLADFAAWLRTLSGVEVEGLYTHFAAAEEGDQTFTRAQYEALVAVSERLSWIPMRHCSASASALLTPELRMDAVRAGIALYGYHPALEQAEDDELRPALSLKARIARLIEVPAGATVGYGRTWTAARPSRIALVMCGYADGLRRALSSRASVLIGGTRAPIAGRIAMDMCMADVTDVAGVAEGDVAVIMGAQGRERIGADELAALADTISWEMLAGLSARVPRLYLRGGEPVVFTTLNQRMPAPWPADSTRQA